MQDGPDLIGRRIGAALIDILVLFVIFGFVAATIGDTEAANGTASAKLDGGQLAVFAALGLLYYGLGEALTGQTLGKKLLGLKVVAEDGSPATTGQVVIRTLLRVVDQLPGAYLLGFVVMLATGAQRKRIGDIVARTRVVAVDGARNL
jgi:uncharacterized RDD family membrane protein YckC